MNISFFLTLAIIFLLILCVFAIVERTNFFQRGNENYTLLNTKKNKGLWIRGCYILLFAGLASAAVSTMKTYLYPTDEKIFRNVDYHVLSHKGYEVGEKFYLANGYTSENNGCPNISLWDGKNGLVLLDRVDSNFVIKEYTDPFYVRKDSTIKYWWQFRKDKELRSYHLVNRIISTDVSKGFVLTCNNDTLYTLKIEPVEDNRHIYISTVYNPDHTCISDTSTFTKVIRQGYPILDIIAKSPRIEISEEMESWFREAYLVRTEIPMDHNIPTFDTKNPPPLCLMPGLSFFHNNKELKINGVAYDIEKTFVIPFSDYANNGKVTFFSGVGQKKTEEFRMSYIPENKMRLEFLMYDKKQIKDTLGHVFINSSIDDISKESLGGGYMYNKFVNDDNLNHINAHFQYIPGNARNELSINITDLNNKDNDLPLYKCNEEFLLHSRDNSTGISWIFEVEDLRKTNDLSSHDILIFILLMFITIAVRILSDSFSESYTLSLTELAIYIILFSLCVVRLILGWRTSTFVPVEDISFPMYLKMRESIFDRYIWIVVLLPLFVTIFVCVWKHNLLHKIQRFFSISNPRYCLFLFLATLVACCFAREIPILNRLCNIPIPIILYFLFEIRMNSLMEQKKMIMLPYRIPAFLLLLLYLRRADAGFIIIFLAYMILHYLVLGNLYKGVNERHGHHYLKYYYLLSMISIAFIFLILYFEGEIMMFILQHVEQLLNVVSAILLIIVVSLLIKYKQWVTNWNKTIRVITCTVCAIFFVTCLFDVCQLRTKITSVVNNKTHIMRYRAEVQRLSGDKKIDDLIQQCEFDSDDLVYILRSAHNQWFINQYIHAGKEMEKNNEFFHIQPHSNQGATFTTQTTDLVVTRYLLAEHGERVVKRILFLWVLLIMLFVLEFKMKERTNRLFLNGPIMIYVISLLVCLSATNRIVFVGQDLPLLSLQSKVAILFPLFLLLLPLGRGIYIRSNETYKDYGDSAKNIRNGIIFATILPLFTWICMSGIEQKGKDQEESQFNVSRLVSNLSIKVDDINERFIVFQEINKDSLKTKTVKEVWERFTEGENSMNKVFYEYLNPETQDFFSSLLHYFEDKQVNKTDVNQLLHLRRRNGKCYLALNKQHYFIPAIMGEENRWSGNIYAAKTPPEMMLFEHGDKAIMINKDKDYEKNVLVAKYKYQIPNMPLMRFDEEWVPGDRPLFLISSKQGQSYYAFFDIEADSLRIKGDRQRNQIATAVLPGDALSLYRKHNNQGIAQTVLNGNMSNIGTPYIVRNMWLNGHKRLFFPLGKQSMWTYHFGNLVSEVYGKDPALRDTSLYLSIDYDLCKAFYASIKKEINERIASPKNLTIIEILEDFRSKSFEEQCDIKNPLYYDKSNKNMVVRSDITDDNIKKAARLVNYELRNLDLEYPLQLEYSLSKAIDGILRTQYDFTAVAIDGDGHIRAMFDYSRNRHLDPNNVTNLNRTISELYQNGSNADERDIFGSKALHYIPAGPASSFKPIAYTSITSQEKLNWESIDVLSTGMTEAQANSEISNSGSHPYAYYGGVSLKKDEELNIQNGGITHDRYLVKSNNLYHSVIILLGMQNQGKVEDVMRLYTDDIEKKEAFPVFTYNGRLMCFDPKMWYENKLPLIGEHDLLTEGLYKNFHIREYAPRLSSAYTYLFGNDELIKKLYDYGKSSRGWVFPETSSLNNADRNMSPLKIGFNQILLGADPLQQTPLQMAVNGSRLASLNRSENMVSILDGDVTQEYKFFDIGLMNGWTEQSYLDFMKRQVWSQLRDVPRNGTASILSRLANEMEAGRYGGPYYLYCKTGTLDPNDSREDRIKHLLVIITDRPLEQVNDVSELRQVRYYTLYLSYLYINNSQFSNTMFYPYIVNVLKSNSFKDYMNKN